MKRSKEYWRGARYGYDAALEMLQKYGKAFAQRGAQELKANLRNRHETHTDFDRGYTHAYCSLADES